MKLFQEPSTHIRKRKPCVNDLHIVCHISRRSTIIPWRPLSKDTYIARQLGGEGTVFQARIAVCPSCDENLGQNRLMISFNHQEQILGTFNRLIVSDGRRIGLQHKVGDFLVHAAHQSLVVD